MKTIGIIGAGIVAASDATAKNVGLANRDLTAIAELYKEHRR